MHTDICFLSATAMAAAIAAKQLSAREVMRAHLEQIERLNPKVNALVTVMASQAMEQAAKADEALAKGNSWGPLHGLPVAIKDLHDTAGIRTTYGSRIFEGYVPERDAIVVERIKRAGGIVLGKTNTPEFGAGSQTFNAVFGATRNPYDLSKTCGGSSGGSAVALACGMAPLASGSDMGGSLRNPAAFCNVIGLRTAPGRVPIQSPALGWFTLAVDGPMARTVADVALLLSVMAGPDERSPISIDEPGSRFGIPLGRDPKGTRIAWAKGLGGIPFDPRVTAVVNAQRPVFESLGCRIEDDEPDFTGADEVFKTLRAWSFEAGFRELLEQHRPWVKDTIVGEVERGARLTGAEVSHAETIRTALYHRVRAFFQKHDFLVLPVTQVPPFDVNQPAVTEILGIQMETYIDWMKSCYFISTVGNPAISIPCGFTPEGLPIGLQIVARHRDEWGLLQIAQAFEQANQAGKRRPSMV